jgi:Cft2 family RNA processing exonuclease
MDGPTSLQELLERIRLLRGKAETIEIEFFGHAERDDLSRLLVTYPDGQQAEILVISKDIADEIRALDQTTTTIH